MNPDIASASKLHGPSISLGGHECSMMPLLAAQPEHLVNVSHLKVRQHNIALN